MAIIMEATSLSSITKIASDPPSIPGQQNSGLPLQPLTLYIARVPGSQDVFLTTLKPREKVISAEDIQNSLYYVHISRQEDLNKFDDEESPAPADSPVISYAPMMQDGRIVRKPAPPPRPVTLSGPLHSPTDHNGAEIRIARRPVGASSQVPQPQRPDSSVPVARPRRLLPAIPQDDIVQPFECKGEAIEQRMSSRSFNKENSSTLPAHSMSSSEQTSTCDIPDIGALTLIRRDPVSCEQWNVANISDALPMPGVSAHAGNIARTFRQHDRNATTPLDIMILNSSYQRFVASDGERSDPHSHNSSTSLTLSMMSHDGIFRRQVHSSHSSPLPANDSNFSHDNNMPPPRNIWPASDLGAIDLPKRHLFRRSADISFNRKSLSSPSPSNGVYNFLSPWGTLCEFSPSKIGNNLRCRYRLPRDTNSSPVELSELRFNLPNSHNKNDNHHKRSSHNNTIRPRSAARNAYRPDSSLSTSHRNASLDEYDAQNDDYDDDDLDDEMRIFQNLGSEKAGGGFGGKRAKLGKLIIHPHGVEMLDLLVAANVGLWWRAWEKVV